MGVDRVLLSPADAMRFVDLAKFTGNEHGCWIWNGGRFSGGYGSLRLNGRAQYAHVLMWEAVHGPVLDGLELDHLCRTPSCCNPRHLEPVTHKINSLRGMSLPAQNARKGTCKRGHPLDPMPPWKGKPEGWRFCRTCARETGRLWARKKRAALRG
jgi:HNH endonuclease